MSIPTDILFYFSGSADKAPGRGANECVSDPSAYRELASIPHWRRVLSNFCEDQFMYNGFTYKTVEHAFQCQKIAMADGDRAYEFTVESGSPLGLGVGSDARAARNMIMLQPQVLDEWDCIKDEIMREILYARFSTSPTSRRVLLATGNAQLWHGAPRIPKERQPWLEEVRQSLQ